MSEELARVLYEVVSESLDTLEIPERLMEKGYAIVPLKPDSAMQNAGYHVLRDHPDHRPSKPIRVYKAMLAASVPKQAVGES